MAAFLGPILGGLASGAAGGLFSKFGTKQRDTTPKFQKQLIDQLLQGLQGQGPLASMFQTDQGAFQTSVADPLLQQFQQQTAPEIQQKFIASGQQRGTPLESSLTRAGTDVQSKINELFLPFQQGAQNRQQQAIQQLLGFSPSSETDITPFGGAAAGFLQSGGIENIIKQLTTSGGGGAQGGLGNLFGGTSGSVLEAAGLPRQGFFS